MSTLFSTISFRTSLTTRSATGASSSKAAALDTHSPTLKIHNEVGVSDAAALEFGWSLWFEDRDFT